MDLTRWTLKVVVLGCGLGLFGGTQAGALQLELVELLTELNSEATTEDADHFFGAIVEETGDAGITGITVTPLGAGATGAPLVLGEGEPGEWEAFAGPFSNLTDQTGSYPFGDYRFDFMTGSGTISETVSYSPIEPTGFVTFVEPTNGQTLSTTPTFMWTLPGGAESTPIDLLLGDRTADPGGPDGMVLLDDIPLSLGQTSFVSPELEPGHDHTLHISLYETVAVLPDDMDPFTVGGDPVLYEAVFAKVESVEFSTVPEPGTALLFVAGLSTLAALRGRSTNHQLE